MARVASLGVDHELQQRELGALLLHHYHVAGFQIKKYKYKFVFY